MISATREVTLFKKVFVIGGSLAVTETPTEFVTILGSCVSVCLWDRKLKIGGMNHFLLPETVNDAKSLNGGIGATRTLIREMTRKLSIIKNLEAKIYGGANRFFVEKSFLNVGHQNVQAAKFALDESGIYIAEHDTGGQSGMKIYFNTQTGIVQVKRIN